MARRHHRSKVTRVVNLVKKIIAFFFSHVGLCALVVGYAMLGAVIFQALESTHERNIQKAVGEDRADTVDTAWNLTFHINKLDKALWKNELHAKVRAFHTRTIQAIKRGYDGKDFGVSQQWTFTGAFLYCKCGVCCHSFCHQLRSLFDVIRFSAHGHHNDR